MASVPSVRVVRSGLVESVHVADVAVCDADGRLVAFAGDASRSVYGRSCTKPLQASVSLAAIGEEPLSDRQVAIDVRLAQRGAGASCRRAVRAPPGRTRRRRPADPARVAARPRDDGPRSHEVPAAPQLLGQARRDAARVRPPGLEPRDLPAPGPPAAASGAGGGRDGDGSRPSCTGDRRVRRAGPRRPARRRWPRCSRASRRPDRLGDLAASPPRVPRPACSPSPYLVGGRARLDTELMSAVDGLVVKEGAEALVCAAVVPQGLGVAVRVADGGDRATGPLLIEALRQLDAIDGRAGPTARRGTPGRPSWEAAGRSAGSRSTPPSPQVTASRSHPRSAHPRVASIHERGDSSRGGAVGPHIAHRPARDRRFRGYERLHPRGGRAPREPGGRGRPVHAMPRGASTHDVREIANGIRVVSVKAGPCLPIPKADVPRFLPEFLGGVLRVAHEDGRGYDIVHSHYWLSGWVGRAAKEEWHAPLVASFHTLGKVKNYSLARGEAPEPADRLEGEQRVIAAADRILAPTPSEAAQLVGLYRADPEQHPDRAAGGRSHALRPGRPRGRAGTAAPVGAPPRPLRGAAAVTQGPRRRGAHDGRGGRPRPRCRRGPGARDRRRSERRRPRRRAHAADGARRARSG